MIGSGIDELDKKILSLITKNARIPFLEVARECNVSGAAVHQRVQRLVNLGVITGSQFNVDPQKLGYTTCVFIGIFLEEASLFEKVVGQIEEIPEVLECHYTTGDYAIFIKLIAHDNNHLKDILNKKIQAIKGIERTDTFISLEERFSRQVPIDQPNA